MLTLLWGRKNRRLAAAVGYGWRGDGEAPCVVTLEDCVCPMWLTPALAKA